YRLKSRLPDRFIGINGGIGSAGQAAAHLRRVDGVMLGRAAYQNPGMLAGLDSEIFGGDGQTDWNGVVEAMQAYAARHIAAGGRLSHVTRHMVGLFHGLPGARRFRQVLSVEGARPGAGPEIIAEAFSQVAENEFERAA